MEGIRNNLRILRIGTLAVLLSVTVFFQAVPASAQTTVETDFVNILNAQRTSLGKPALAINSSLSNAAYLHSKDMAENHYFAHTSPDGTTFVQRIIAAGYTNYSALAENIAYHYGAPDASTIYNLWKNSPGHYANMIGDYTDTGLGVYHLNGYSYCTLDLGKSNNPAPAPATIGYSPSSFAFTATQEGANPPNQILNIQNIGGGTLNWSVTDDAAWLTLSPTSGSSTGEIDPVTLLVNISGMTAGNYNATLTISAPEATDTPRIATASLTISPPTRKEGDVNNDGLINSGDALLVAKNIVGTGTLSGDDFLAADVNDDGVVNSADLLLIKKYIVATIIQFPGGVYIP